jgi:hypothetical protein
MIMLLEEFWCYRNMICIITIGKRYVMIKFPFWGSFGLEYVYGIILLSFF